MGDKKSLMGAIHEQIGRELNAKATAASFRGQGNCWEAETLDNEVQNIQENIKTMCQMLGVDEEEARRTYPDSSFAKKIEQL